VETSNAELADDFRDFIGYLNAHQVAFVLVGGYAVGWHGVVRATGDIDFLYQQTSANVGRLCAALREFGAPDAAIDAGFLMSPNAVTQIGVQPRRIDLLAAITGVTFAQVRAGAEQIELEGLRLLVIGLDELRVNKGATGRAKDRDDLRRLGKASRTSTKPPARPKNASSGRNAKRLGDPRRDPDP
jgi:predicted nucleotidyltransferase